MNEFAEGMLSQPYLDAFYDYEHSRTVIQMAESVKDALHIDDLIRMVARGPYMVVIRGDFGGVRFGDTTCAHRADVIRFLKTRRLEVVE